MDRPATISDRVNGLDSIRFICALWVFFGHGAAPALSDLFAEGSLASHAWRGFYNNLWSGPSAVIVFFVISGFCIHYPFADSTRRPRLKEFYARRFLRLLIPVAVAVPLSYALGFRPSSFQSSILWSLLAELIYYIIYPALRNAQLRMGSWRGIVITSFVIAAGVAATNPLGGNYPSFGPALTWLVGLPCWLLGCVLAESVRHNASLDVSSSTVWKWRAVVFGTAWVCSVLRFHTPIGYPWTLNFFAILVAFWLTREIAFRRRVEPWRGLEWAGSWSYSLYLIHMPIGAFFKQYVTSSSGFPIPWILMVLFVLTSCFLFYLLVERPSHFFARIAAQRLRPSLPQGNESSVGALVTSE